MRHMSYVWAVGSLLFAAKNLRAITALHCFSSLHIKHNNHGKNPTERPGSLLYWVKRLYGVLLCVCGARI